MVSGEGGMNYYHRSSPPPQKKKKKKLEGTMIEPAIPCSQIPHDTN